MGSACPLAWSGITSSKACLPFTTEVSVTITGPEILQQLLPGKQFSEKGGLKVKQDAR